MDVIFVGPFYQNDGWGQAAKDYLRALTITKHNIYGARVDMSQMLDKEPEEWMKVIPIPPASFKERPKVIYNILPGIMKPNSAAYNIWLGYTETNNLQHTGWIEELNLFDECWVATTKEKENLIHSGVEVPINVVPMPINTSIDLSQGEKDEVFEDKFVFYFIGDGYRKNLQDMLIAYWREFSVSEPVTMLVKFRSLNDSQARGYIKAIQQQARLYNTQMEYADVACVTDFVSENGILDLHKQGDCFIIVSYGESTCRPMLLAHLLGKKIICTDGISAAEPWMKINRVTSYETPCKCPSPPLNNIYTSFETWRQIDILELQKTMRAVYNGGGIYQNQSDLVKEIHSYESVAKTMDDIL